MTTSPLDHLEVLRQILDASDVMIPRWIIWTTLVLGSLVLGWASVEQRGRQYRREYRSGVDRSGATMWRGAAALRERPAGSDPLYGKPGWVRVALYPVPVLIACAIIEAPRLSMATGVALVVVASVMLPARLRRRRFERVFVRPLFHSLAPTLGITAKVESPRSWIRVPRGLFDLRDYSPEREGLLQWLAWGLSWPLRTLARGLVAGGRWVAQRSGAAPVLAHVSAQVREVYRFVYPSSGDIRIRLPDHFSAIDQTQEAVDKIVNKRLPGTWEARWDVPRGVVTYRRAQELPKHVAFRDLVDILDHRDYARIPIAMQRGEQIFELDLVGKTPHTVVSGSTGYGKSSTALVYIVWAYLCGATVDIMDPGRTEYDALEGLPGIRIHRDVDSMAHAIRSRRQNMEARYAYATEQGIRPEDLPKDKFPPNILVSEETGSLVAMLKTQWADAGRKGQPPELTDWMYLLWQGRKVKQHVLTLAHQVNANVMISTDAKAQYMCKIVLGPQELSSWRMMFGNAPKVRISSKKGRGLVAIGPDDITDVQMTFVEDHEAREIAELRPDDLPTHDIFERPDPPPRRTEAPRPPQQNQPEPAAPSAVSLQAPPERPGVPDARTQADTPGETPAFVPDAGTVPPQQASPAAPTSSRPRFKVLPGGLLDELTGEAEQSEDRPEDVPQESALPSTDVEPIVGTAAAAQFLGYKTQAAFEQARKRWRKNHGEIEGEFRVGSSPAWYPHDLTKWLARLPRSGARVDPRKRASSE